MQLCLNINNEFLLGLGLKLLKKESKVSGMSHLERNSFRKKFPLGADIHVHVVKCMCYVHVANAD